jgi:hypothetical protein
MSAEHPSQSACIWRWCHETEALEEHVEGCASCAALLDEERRFFAAMNTRASAEISHSLLAECRHDLMREVYRAEPEPVSAWGRVGAWFSAGRGSGLPWQPALLTASLIAVFFVGRATNGSVPDQLVWHESQPGSQRRHDHRTQWRSAASGDIAIRRKNQGSLGGNAAADQRPVQRS